MKFCIEDIGLSDVRPKLTEIIRETHDGVRFAVDRHGTPVAGIVNFSDLRALEALTRLSPSDLARVQAVVSRKKRIAIGIIIGWLDSQELDDDA